MYSAKNSSSSTQLMGQQKRLEYLLSELDKSQNNLTDMKAAKSDLELIKTQYRDVIKSPNNYIARIIVMDPLGLVCVKNIQEAVSNAYSGASDKNFSNSLDNTLSSIQGKITNENNKITDTKREIASLQSSISALQSQTIGRM